MRLSTFVKLGLLLIVAGIVVRLDLLLMLGVLLLGVPLIAGAARLIGGLRGEPRRAATGGWKNGSLVPYLIHHADPWAEVVNQFDTDWTRQVFVGLGSAGDFILSRDRQHVLILGPPRSYKTAGCLVPMIVSAPGPVVSTSIKDDVYRATAQSRSRMGHLWHFNLAGSGQELPGTKSLRWSPIPPSADWDTALRIGKAMADASEVASGTTDSGFFRAKAGELTAALLHAAGLADKSMEWMLRAVGEIPAVLDEAERILYGSSGPNAQVAGDLLHSIVSLDPRSRGPIFATTSTAFAAYRSESARATTIDPNFDPAAFVAGSPNMVNIGRFTHETRQMAEQLRTAPAVSGRGVYDTIYITAKSEEQALMAPLVVGLLSTIREATYDLSRLDQLDDIHARRPVLFALDEVANLAPLRDLPSTLSQSGGQNLIVVAVMQDLSQARARWDKEGDGFLTLFGEIVVFPGIRNEQTLRQISELSGKRWEQRTSISTGESQTTSDRWGGDSSYTQTRQETVSEQLVPKKTISEIRRCGPDDVDLSSLNPFRMLVIQSAGSIGYAESAPYFCAPPYLQVLISSAAHLAVYGSAFSRRAEILPPVLDLDDFSYTRTGGGERAVAQVQEAQAEFTARRDERKKLLAWMSTVPLLAGYDEELGDYGLDFALGQTTRNLVVSETALSVEEIAQVLDPWLLGMTTPEPDTHPQDFMCFEEHGPGLPTWVLVLEKARVEVAVMTGRYAKKYIAYRDSFDPVAFPGRIKPIIPQLMGPPRTAVIFYTADRLGIYLAQEFAKALAAGGVPVLHGGPSGVQVSYNRP